MKLDIAAEDIGLLLAFTIDDNAKKLVDESFKQAVIVFGSAKALNGVISLAQGTEINLPFVVVAIGQILDPINDLVEQFSLIMLASLVSLGIQKILLRKTALQQDLFPWESTSLKKYVPKKP